MDTTKPNKTAPSYLPTQTRYHVCLIPHSKAMCPNKENISTITREVIPLPSLSAFIMDKMKLEIATLKTTCPYLSSLTNRVSKTNTELAKVKTELIELKLKQTGVGGIGVVIGRTLPNFDVMISPTLEDGVKNEVSTDSPKAHDGVGAAERRPLQQQ